MVSATTLKLDMALRALGFCRANPIPGDPTATTVVHLEEHLKRAEGLTVQQEAGQQAVTISTRRRLAALRALRVKLKLLAGIGAAAAEEVPELEGIIRVPSGNASQAEILTATRTVVETVSARKDLFLRYGMPATLLDDIAALLAEYDAATADRHGARRTHTGARAELASVAEEIMSLVDHLDVLNSYHFHDAPEPLAAWISARNIPWPQHRPSDDPPSDSKAKPAA